MPDAAVIEGAKKYGLRGIILAFVGTFLKYKTFQSSHQVASGGL